MHHFIWAVKRTFLDRIVERRKEKEKRRKKKEEEESKIQTQKKSQTNSYLF